MESWRLVVQNPLTGHENMAVDEAIMESVSANEVPPTIRFYLWDPPCVSLGYFQKAEKEIDLKTCDDLGFDIVRRPTGGRAVLHKDELTYSVIVKEEHPKIPKEVVKAYKVLSSGLLIGLNTMGFFAKMNELHEGENRQQKGSAACFDAPSWYELVVQDKKVIGSAQVRKHGVLLQHGSIPINMDLEALLSVLKFSSKQVKERTKKILEKKAAGLNDIAPDSLEVKITTDNLIKFLKQGFETALTINLYQGELTENEQQKTAELLEKKYGQDEWNFKR